MDRLAGKLPNTTSRLIAMAVSLVGDGETVRSAMQSSAEDFGDYRAGRKEPPFPELDRLVNLIIREQGQMIARTRELLARNRARRRGDR